MKERAVTQIAPSYHLCRTVTASALMFIVMPMSFSAVCTGIASA